MSTVLTVIAVCYGALLVIGHLFVILNVVHDPSESFVVDHYMQDTPECYIRLYSTILYAPFFFIIIHVVKRKMKRTQEILEALPDYNKCHYCTHNPDSVQNREN